MMVNHGVCWQCNGVNSINVSSKVMVLTEAGGCDA